VVHAKDDLARSIAADVVSLPDPLLRKLRDHMDSSPRSSIEAATGSPSVDAASFLLLSTIDSAGVG
jgi:hypothetical protein